MQAILERNSTLTANAIARAFDSLTAPSLAPDADLRTEAELPSATTRPVEALSQRWGQHHSFIDLNIEHLIPPDTVVEWAHS